MEKHKSTITHTTPATLQCSQFLFQDVELFLFQINWGGLTWVVTATCDRTLCLFCVYVVKSADIRGVFSKHDMLQYVTKMN